MIRTIITISPDDKKWLDNHSRRQKISCAAVVRRAIKEYRQRMSRGGLHSVLRETAGKWEWVEGDSQDLVHVLRGEWEDRS